MYVCMYVCIYIYVYVCVIRIFSFIHLSNKFICYKFIPDLYFCCQILFRLIHFCYQMKNT